MLYSDTGQKRVKCIDIYHGVKLFSSSTERMNERASNTDSSVMPSTQRTNYVSTETKKMALK